MEIIDNILEVSLMKKFENFELQANVQFKRGISAIFAPSGTGKTTLLNCISGKFKPDSGLVKSFDTVLFSSDFKIDIPPENRSIGYVMQDSSLFPHLNVNENIYYGYNKLKDETMSIDPKWLVDLLNLNHLLDRDVKNLSGGEKQRVALARTLCSFPEILLLDEPLVSVDNFSRNHILKTLQDVNRQFHIPIIYVTHSFSEILTFADYILFMKSGKTTRYGELRKLFWELEDKEYFDDEELQTVLKVNVLENIISNGITKSSVNGLILWTPLIDQPEGSVVNISIHAKDVILANKPVEGISARNIINASITDMKSLDTSVLVLAESNGVSIMSEITHESSNKLGLNIGEDVYLIIKTNSIYVESVLEL